MSKREENTVATKERIVDAAEVLFDKYGITSTSLASIAQEANVSTGTIFAYYPAKSDIIRAILRRLFEKSTLRDLPSEPARSPDEAMDQLRAIVQRAVDAGARSVRAVSAAWSAIQLDPAFAGLWEREQSRRWNELKLFTTQWAENGLLKPNLSATQAADILWSMTGPLVFRAFVRESGWDTQQYDRWLKMVLYREVLGVGTPPEFR